MRNITNMAEAYKEIREKLKPSDGAGAYVKDFRKSDAPQFKGKSDAKKMKMAIAAYLDAKDKNENISEDRKIMISTKDKKIEKDIVMMVKKNNLGISLSKSSKGITADGNTKDLTKLVDGLFDKHMSKIINPNNPPFEIRMEKLDDKDTSVVKAVVAKLKKASGAHAGQAKDLQKAIDEDKELKEAKFAVQLMGIPGAIYIDAESAGKVKQKIRKMLRKPDDLISVERVLPTDFKADLRQRIKGVPSDDTEMAQKEEVEEAANPAQQAAIAISMKKAGKKPKSEMDEKKNYKYNKNFFVNDKTDTLKKMSGRDGYGEVELTNYLAQKTGKDEDDVYFDDVDLVYKDKTVLRNAYRQTVEKMLKALQKVKENFDEPEFSKKNFAVNRIGLAANKHLNKKELGKHTDEGRKSKYDMDQDDEEGANKNIIMQLRKSVDLKGRFDVEFEDGKKVKVKDTIARAAVLKHAGMRRPAEKLAFQKKIEKSYRDLLNALKGR